MKIKEVFSRLSGYWLYKRRYLPIGIDLFVDLKQFFKEQQLKVVFDVGANEGQTIEQFRNYISFGQLISFEPVPSTFNLLSKNVRDSDRIVIENIGLGAEAAEMDVMINEHSALNSLKLNEGEQLTGEKERVTIDTLDNYFNKNHLPEISFLKIDTEGFEMEVLQGAEKTIKEGKIKYIYCEVGFDEQNKRHTPWQKLHEYLVPLGYRFVALYDMSYKVFKDHSGNALYVLEAKKS
ncbi:MAG: FkbM family methyltransferase [Vicingaceae bacterium]